MRPCNSAFRDVLSTELVPYIPIIPKVKQVRQQPARPLLLKTNHVDDNQIHMAGLLVNRTPYYTVVRPKRVTTRDAINSPSSIWARSTQRSRTVTFDIIMETYEAG